VILLLVGRQLGASTLAVAGSTRLPMVAGWDHLLPQWFAKLHPRFKTPVNSILFVGGMILAAGLVSLAGVGQQEAFQILDNAAGIFYALTYLVMFAIPVVGFRRSAHRPPLWLRGAAVSGFVVTLLYHHPGDQLGFVWSKDWGCDSGRESVGGRAVSVAQVFEASMNETARFN
jgi:amino acid transporter